MVRERASRRALLKSSGVLAAGGVVATVGSVGDLGGNHSITSRVSQEGDAAELLDDPEVSELYLGGADYA